MAIFFWSFFLFLVIWGNVYGQITDSRVILYSKLLHFAAAFIPIFFFHFVLAFLYKDKNNKLVIRLGYGLAVIFGILSLTKFIVLGSAAKIGFNHWIDVGSLYAGFVAYFWIYVLASIYFLFRGYKNSDGITRKKTGYILAAVLISFIGGGMSFLPQTLNIYPYGNFVAWLYPVLITYGIFIK